IQEDRIDQKEEIKEENEDVLKQIESLYSNSVGKVVGRHRHWITSLSFHPNYNSLILSSSSDKTCAVWSTGEESVRIDRNDLILIGEQQKKKNEKDKNVGQNIDRIQDRYERGWSFGQENKKTELIDRNCTF
ncbi:MAG: hypothetical protein EZS28_041001, partial [Streblomastix strix]